MAQIDTIKFSDIAIALGDGATPTEVFTTPCGITDYTWNTSVETNDEDLPDCENPDLVGYQSSTVISVGDSLDFEGYVDGDGQEIWFDYAHSGESRNIRVIYTKGTNAAGGRKGHYQGPAIMSARSETYTRRQSGRVSGTLTFTAKPVWTPAV